MNSHLDSNSIPRISPDAGLRVMRIISGALLSGALFFMGLVIYLVSSGQISSHKVTTEHESPQKLLTLVLTLAAVPPVVLSFVLPPILQKSHFKQVAQEPSGTDPVPRLVGIWQTTSIITLALLEGPSFMGSIAYLLEGQWLALVVASVPILFMLARFPTSGSQAAWLFWAKEEVARLRIQGGSAARIG